MARSKQGDRNDTVEIKSKPGFAFLCYTFGAMLYMIGFPSEYFIENLDTQTRYGLWASCNTTTNICTRIGGSYGWLAGARAFLTTGVIGLIACMLFIAIYIGAPIMNRRKNIVLLFMLTIATVIVQLIGIIIYGAGTTTGGSASWSYLLVIVGCIIYVIAAILVGLEACAPSRVINRNDD